MLFSITYAQKSDSTYLSKQDLIGIWQINSSQIGSSLSECFRFYNDGNFIYQYNPSDDTRNIIKLKGRYRMDKRRLFLIITSRIERIGGNIITGAVGTDEFLFVYDNDSTRTIIEKNTKELDPLFVVKVSRHNNNINIFINDRHYYKISSNPDKW
jgi:hypothetical protein